MEKQTGPTFLRVGIKDFEFYIRYAIRNKISCLVEGRPGIGKTQITTRIAKEEGKAIHVLHPANYDYGDLATKIPSKDDKDWHMVEVFDNSLPTQPGTVLLIDDFTHGDKGVTRQFYRLIQEGRLGSTYNLPEDTTIIAIYNPTDDVEAEELEGPLIDRFKMRFNVETDKDSVIEYFESNPQEYSTYVAGFLRFKPDMLTLQNEDKGNRYELTPRRWDYLTDTGAKDLPEFRKLAQAILPNIASIQFDEFVKKIEIYQGKIERFVTGEAPFPDAKEDQFAVMAAICGHISTDAKYEPLIDKVLDMKMKNADEEIKALIVFQSLRTYKKRKNASSLTALMTKDRRDKILSVLKKYDYIVDSI